MASPGSKDAPQRGASWRQSLHAVVLCALALLVAACGSGSSTGIQGASEVQAQPVNTAGNNPFTASVGKDRPGITPPSGASSTSGGPAQYTANTPGLYGGTRNYKQCNASQLVSFLQQNPSKATAWASTLGIRMDQISDYVSKLTGVLLRTDTRVTNHGYVNGQANAFQAVLEAGTAVMVDQYGRPVVKCYCGNPLTAPTLLSAPSYTGPTWSSFSTTSIFIIQQSTTIIQKFYLYDPDTGKIFTRTPGQNGTDGPYTQAPPGTPNANTTGQQSSSGGGGGNPSVSLSPNPVVQGTTETLSASGFGPNKNLDITVVRPDGVTEHYSTTTDSSGNGSYSFNGAAGAAPVGTYNVTVTDSSTGASASGSTTVIAPGGGQNPGTPATPPHTTT